MNAPHFDDESLSAALDGQDEEAAAHLAGCAECRARSQALAGAAHAVTAGSEHRAPPGVADRAVAAALAAFDAERLAPGGPAAPADRPTVVPLHRSNRAAAGTIPSERRRRLPPWALGVAAALAAVLAAVPVIASLGAGDDDTQTAATATADSDTKLANEDAGAGRAVVDGGDLGDQSDQVALGSLVATALGEEAPARSSPVAPAPGTEASAAAAEAQRAADAAATAGSPAPAAAPPPAYSQGAATAGATVCEQQLVNDLGDRLGPLEYRATLRWQGTPAVVLAYGAGGATGDLHHQVFVMALEGCGILASQGF